MSKFLQEFKFSLNGNEYIQVERGETHAYPLTWKFAFKAWRLKEINLSLWYSITWWNLFQGIQMCHGRRTLDPKSHHPIIHWNVPDSPTWWIFSNTTSWWLRKKHIHHSLEERLPISLIKESFSKHRYLDQESKIKSRDHSYRHVPEIVRKVTAHVRA